MVKMQICVFVTVSVAHAYLISAIIICALFTGDIKIQFRISILQLICLYVQFQLVPLF